MPELDAFDKMVGKIAGAIYSDISRQFPHPPLMLVPALTFKVRKLMEQVTDLKLLTNDQKTALATDIQASIVPMLFSYDIEARMIEQITPAIKAAAIKALNKMWYDA